LEILESVVAKCGAIGPHLSDAVLAALAIENDAVLASTDRDFRRFDNLRWINPLS
jgi:predicted nucleic acid-binding protein